MSNVWTISGEAGKALGAGSYTLDELNAYGTRVVFRNLATDTLTFSIPLASLASTAEIVPELGQVVSLRRSGTQIFKGHVTGRRQTGRVIAITVSGPWWWLERIFLQSPQVDNTGLTAERPTYVFPSQSLSTSLWTIAQKAIALGVPMGIGGISNTFDSPPMRVNQTSYAGAIADIVRVTPDMVLAFAYDEAVPRLFTFRRLYAGELTLDARNLSGFELNPLTELEVTQVKVPYMTRSPEGRRQFVEQTAGNPALGKVYIHTVSGAEMDTFLPPDIIKTTLTTGTPETVNVTSGFSANSLAYIPANFDPVLSRLAKKYGGVQGSIDYMAVWLGDYTAATALSKGPATICKNAAGNSQSLAGKFILLSPTLPDWAALQLGAIRVTYSGTWYYYGQRFGYGSAPPPMTAQEKELAAGAEVGLGWFYKPNKHVLRVGDGTESVRYIKRSWSATVTLINRDSGTITRAQVPTAVTSADYIFRFPPAGYAEGLLAAQNYIPYEGRFTVVEDHAGFNNFRYYAINFSNSQPAHASVRAMVSEEEIEIATGKTTVRLGPPARFSYRELVNRVKTNSNDQIIYL